MAIQKPKQSDSWSRRQTLLVLSSGLCAGPVFRAVAKENLTGSHQDDLPRGRSCFSSGQLETISCISERIIPADEHSAGAESAHVYDFIDEIVSTSVESVQKFWVEGLAAVDTLAVQMYGRLFKSCGKTEQVAVLTALSAKETNPQSPADHFFIMMKDLTIDGYYRSAVGIHEELQYRGNSALRVFPGCSSDSAQSRSTEHGH